MSSPFPGMDPFLEHPDIFPDLHDRLNTHLSEVLQASLPAPYYAVIGRRTWIEVSQRYIGPDVQVQRSRRDHESASPGSGYSFRAGRRNRSYHSKPTIDLAS